MSQESVRPRRLPIRSISLRLEGLEGRCLLSGMSAKTVTFQEVLNGSTIVPGTSVLTITGTKKNDAITINDNGTGTAGNIFVSTGSGQDFMSTGAVSELLVKPGGGNDNITYELDSNLQPNVSELIEVGSKGTTVGSVQFTVNIVGKVLDHSSLAIFEAPVFSRKSTMTVNDSGEVDGDLTAGIAALGSTKIGRSPELFQFQSTAAIGPDGEIAAGVIGSRANDFGSFSYSGLNNGELDIVAQGNGGNDQFDADAFMIAGSTGTVGTSGSPSLIRTAGKKDKLNFTIERGTDSTSTTGIYAELIDTSKKDTSTHTGNVTATTKGADTTVM
jgi:hypothetical protein